jgi:hypothetical protein
MQANGEYMTATHTLWYSWWWAISPNVSPCGYSARDSLPYLRPKRRCAGSIGCGASIADYSHKPSLEAFAKKVDVITYEFENVPAATAQFLSTLRPLYPIANALAIGRRSLHEKQFFRD